MNLRNVVVLCVSRSGESVEEFAERIGVSRSTVYSWLDGTRTPGRLSRRLICAEWETRRRANEPTCNDPLPVRRNRRRSRTGIEH